MVQNTQNPQKTATGIARQPTKKEQKETFQKRRLVLFTTKEYTTSSFEIRNQINASFKEKLGISTPVLGAVTKSVRK